MSGISDDEFFVVQRKFFVVLVKNFVVMFDCQVDVYFNCIVFLIFLGFDDEFNIWFLMIFVEFCCQVYEVVVGLMEFGFFCEGCVVLFFGICIEWIIVDMVIFCVGGVIMMIYLNLGLEEVSFILVDLYLFIFFVDLMV